VRPAHSISLVRLFTLVALAASAALFVDYTSYSPTFCTATNSGCGAVRASGYGYLLGMIPVPLAGLIGFGAVLVVSLLPAGGLRKRLLAPLAVGGAAIGLLLFALQALVIKRYCEYCMAADASSLLIAVFAVLHRQAIAGTPSDQNREHMARWSWAALGGLAIAAPLVWPHVRPEPPVPADIRAFYVPGKINVVEFADYECPFCRGLAPRLKQVMSAYPGRVNFVRLNLPLDRIHPQARDAARAQVCAAEQGKGEEMADALFEAKELSLKANRRIAVGMGLDMDRFDKCVADAATDKRIDQQGKLLRDAGFSGLPTTFVGADKVVGAQPDDVFRKAFEQAARGDNAQGMPGWLYLVIVGILALGLAGAGAAQERRRRARAA
jgi:uncharacterized membrane protein/predicted DsbA family dithiol-disulfide isomerase